MTYAITAGGKQHNLSGSGHWSRPPLCDDDLVSLDPELAERIRATVEAAVMVATDPKNGNCEHSHETMIPTLHELETEDAGVTYFAKQVDDKDLYQLDGISWQVVKSIDLISIVSEDLVDKITDAVAQAAADAVKVLLNAKPDEDEAPTMPAESDPALA